MKRKSNLFSILCLVFLLSGCTGGYKAGGGGDSASSDSSNASGTTDPSSPTTTTNPTTNPACSDPASQIDYNTTVTQHTVNQDEIAQDCVDSAAPYDVNIGFTPDNVFMNVRYETTCASRWCNTYLSESTSIGVTTSNLVFNGNSLDLSASVQVQCRSSRTEMIMNPCTNDIIQGNPLESYSLNYTDPRCSFCGCDSTAALAHWSTSKQSLIDCGTQFCKAENSSFHWGMLSEANTDGFVIRCSRADVP